MVFNYRDRGTNRRDHTENSGLVPPRLLAEGEPQNVRPNHADAAELTDEGTTPITHTAVAMGRWQHKEPPPCQAHRTERATRSVPPSSRCHSRCWPAHSRSSGVRRPTTPGSCSGSPSDRRTRHPLDGWRSDHGEPYDSRRAYGWVRDNDRQRAGLDDRARHVAVAFAGRAHRHLHHDAAPEAEVGPLGAWTSRHGTYRVTVTVGDPAARGRHADPRRRGRAGRRALQVRPRDEPTTHRDGRRARSPTVASRSTRCTRTAAPRRSSSRSW